jgi:hypothetical protein
MTETLMPQDTSDFRWALSKSFLRRAWGLVRGQNTDLMAWDDVRDYLRLRGFIRRGVQTVPVDKIVGSVGRYRDFDDAFLPRQDTTSTRWRKINRAFYEDVSLPPVHLYKVGDVYFVLDGNHRISVAKEHGVKFIDADVQEAVTPVNLTSDDIDADTLVMLGEYTEFLERTHLDVLRPEQNIRFSIGGGYARLIEHIAVHRYFMGLDLKRDISEDEAVSDWFDNAYMPIIKAIREEGILHNFPNRTEADLYLWIIDHKHYLKDTLGYEVPAEKAAADYAEHYAEKPALQRIGDVIGALGAIVSAVIHNDGSPPDERHGSPPSGDPA